MRGAFCSTETWVAPASGTIPMRNGWAAKLGRASPRRPEVTITKAAIVFKDAGVDIANSNSAAVAIAILNRCTLPLGHDGMMTAHAADLMR